MIGTYLGQADGLKLVLVVIDARIGITDLDVSMMEQLRGNGIPFVIVANKADKLNQSEAAKLKHDIETGFPGIPVVFHSNVTGRGRSDVWKAVEEAVRPSRVA